MPRIILTLFSCFLVFAFSSLQAQEVDSKAVPKEVEQANGLDKALEAGGVEEDDLSILDGKDEDADAIEKVAVAEDEDEATAEEVAEGPAVVSVNAQGELVGMASATVNGDPVPIEANITLVSGGVLIGKVVADENGSFSFPNVLPGDYNVFGCAASYCGQRSCTVVSASECPDHVVNVELDQVSECGCNGGFASAPAASFDGGIGSGGSGFGGGGFGGGAAGGGGGAAGGGGLIGTRGFRLLAIGGVATAIAVGASSDSDDVSPSE